jgi:hypothetical protein
MWHPSDPGVCIRNATYMRLTPMAAPLMSREEATAMLEEQDILDHSQLRSAADVRRSKGLAAGTPIPSHCG